MTTEETKKVEGVDILQEMKKRGLIPPSALNPPGKEYPAVLSGEFHPERENPPFFSTVRLNVQWGKDAPAKPFFVTSNYHGSGAVALVVVEDKILFVRQWRVNIGQETVEIPRGFSEKWDSGKETTVDTLPKGVVSLLELQNSAETALREAQEEVGLVTSSVVPVYLGKLFQNSGTETNQPDFWLLLVRGYLVRDSTTLLTLEEAENSVTDMHSASALLLYRRYLRQQQG